MSPIETTMVPELVHLFSMHELDTSPRLRKIIFYHDKPIPFQIPGKPSKSSLKSFCTCNTVLICFICNSVPSATANACADLMVFLISL